MLAEAIGVELAGHGVSIIDTEQTTTLMGRLNLDEFELSVPQSLVRLKEKGVDAVVVVKSVSNGRFVSSGVVKVTSTRSGRLLAGVTFDNPNANGTAEVAVELAGGVAAALSGENNTTREEGYYERERRLTTERIRANE